MDIHQLLKSINQNINEGIYRSNEKGIIYVNQAFLKLFGFDTEEEAYSYDSRYLYKFPEERVSLIEQTKRQGAFENEEVTLIKKNGEEFTALINSVIHRDENGHTYWDGAIRDVTRQVQERQHTRARDQLLDSINRNINEAIYRSINQEGVVYVNDAFVKMFGYTSEEEILSSEVSNLYKHSKDRGSLGAELVLNGSVTNKEIEFKRKDGSVFWGSISAIKTIGEDGTVYFDGAIRNITEKKEAEEAMKHHTEMQRLLIKISTSYINLPLDHVEDSIQDSLKELAQFVGADRAYIFDIDFHKQAWSSQYEWCSIGVATKLEKDQVLPLAMIQEVINLYVEGEAYVVRDVSEITNKSYRDLLIKQGVKSLASAPIMAGKYCVGFVGFDSIRSPQDYQPSDVSLLKLFAELMVNIHSRSQNEHELAQLLNTTTDQNKRLKDFSYIISHNMRSSVANLIGLTQELAKNPSNGDFLLMLKATGEKLNKAIHHINDLLNFENEISVLKKESVSLIETIENVLELNNQIIREKNVEIIASVDNNLKIKGFPVYLESIFQNIITNAIKYGITEKSKRIEIDGFRKDHQVVVQVKDYGLGIDLVRFRDKIFRLGARFHAKQNQGQGLGLFMTKHQVEAMGGTIEVESKVSKGTTFKIYFNG